MREAEFRAMVVAQANDPARSIADVAHEHGLNANMVARWRRTHDSTTLTQPQPTETFISVQRTRWSIGMPHSLSV
jgi:transposase